MTPPPQWGAISEGRGQRRDRRPAEPAAPRGEAAFRPSTNKNPYERQKAHGWHDHLAKLLTLAYLSLECHKEVEAPPPAEGLTEGDIAAEEVPPEEVEESEDEVDMSALTAFNF